MGHERVGALPRSKNWMKIIQSLSDFPSGVTSASEIGTATLQNVSKQFSALLGDPSFLNAVNFIVKFTCGLRGDMEAVGLPNCPSIFDITRVATESIKHNAVSTEYSHLATKAAVEAITDMLKKHKDKNASLFESLKTPFEVLKTASNGAGFSDVVRSFFAHYTNNYMKYFVDRAASGIINNLADRERLDREISMHAFETTKIIQSYSAGWFNKFATGRIPTAKEIGSYTEFAFKKLKSELLREGRNGK